MFKSLKKKNSYYNKLLFYYNEKLKNKKKKRINITYMKTPVFAKKLQLFNFKGILLKEKKKTDINKTITLSCLISNGRVIINYPYDSNLIKSR